jgi:hypothetical protein
MQRPYHFCIISSIIPIFAADEAKYCDINDHRIFIIVICPETGHNKTENPEAMESFF